MTATTCVLVVDADRISAAAMTACLRKHGFMVERPLHKLSRIHERLNLFQGGIVVLGVEVVADECVLTSLVTHFPEIAFIVCTSRPSEVPLAGALACGARGYLVSLGGQHLLELPTAVQRVAAGEVFLTELAEALRVTPAQPKARLTDDEARSLLQTTLGWTRKEAEVGLLLQRGTPEKRIGAELGIGKHTVHGRLRQLYRRHGLQGIADLVRVATEALSQGGQVSSPGPK